MRARRFVNDVLLDQIPVLAEMQRFMDELSIVQAPEPTAMSDRQCLMQQVAAFQECITRGADYAAIAKRQIDEIWTAASMHDDDLKALVDVYPRPRRNLLLSAASGDCPRPRRGAAATRSLQPSPPPRTIHV